ncbi:MAG: DUF2723 domain-containing protein [Chloroflexi bacterium]|nr:DUF2723 domain-containing protein [Chloroflexota bacterium]
MDKVLPAVLFLVTIISRGLFPSHYLYHWDSVNFAFAIVDFDIAKEQPQPPGYILYVLLVRGINVLVHNANLAMVLVSILASALAVIMLYLLGRELFNLQTGILAALFLLISPLFWFYGEIALPHTLDAFLVILVAYWGWRVLKGEQQYLYLETGTLAIASGVRPQTLLFLLPVYLFSIHRVPLKKIILAGLLGFLICLAWFVPMIQDTGGLTRYLEVMDQFSMRFQESTSIFLGAGAFGLVRNLTKLALYSGYGVGLAAVPFAARLVFRRRVPGELEDRRMAYVFLVLWTAPAFLYYLFVHMGQQGLVFVYLPAILIFGAWVGDRLMRSYGTPAQVLIAACIVLNGAIFVLAPEFPLPGRSSIRLLTRQTIQQSDVYLHSRIAAIEENFSPANTSILATNWHHVEYYLPQFKVIEFDIGSKWEIDAGEPTSVGTVQVGSDDLLLQGQAGTAIVLFDPELSEFNQSPQETRSLKLAEGQALEYFQVEGAETFLLEGGTFRLVP